VKKIVYLLLPAILIFSLILSGCGITPGNTPSPTAPASSSISPPSSGEVSTAAPTTPLPTTSSGSGTSGSGTLTLTSTDPYTLDPAISSDSLSAGYIVQLFSGLLKPGSNLEPAPDIAESLPTLSPDGLTYTFHLRQDVKFQDGRGVTAADFKYAWERASDPATASPTAATYLGDIVGVDDMLAGKANQISGVKAVDNYTLQVTIDSPKSYFLYKLTYPASYVVDRNNVNSGANWWQKPNGTGPFTLQEWVKGTDIILARNGLYYGDKAKIAQIKYILNSTTGDMDLFETGQIDIAGASPAYYDKIMDRSQPFYQDLAVSPELSISYIGFNCKQPPFDDVNIRKAFSLAIDKDKIISLTYRDMLKKASGILPPGIPGYNNNLTGPGFDISQAKALISASRYGDVSRLPPITMTIAGAGGSADPVSQALVYQWKLNLGVDVKIRELEPQFYNSNLGPELDQMYSFGWIADYPYPQDFLDILFSSGSSYNYGGYASSQVDALIRQANQDQDHSQALTLYQQAEQQIVDDAACLPLTFGENFLLVQPYVQDLKVNALGTFNLNEITIAAH
jgi:oligopeptide transport system substrate-binding protein